MTNEILQSIGMAALGIAQILTTIQLMKMDDRLDDLYDKLRKRMR